MYKRMVYVILAALVALSLFASGAAAHKTVYSSDNKIKFVYGHIGEPIFTNQKTGLDLGIYDNATGGPISGLEFKPAGPNLDVQYRYGAEGGQTLDITTGFVAQHGAPGKYTYPIMFTKPGIYSILLKGTINGTAYDMVIPPAHEVKEIDTIRWPEAAGDSDARIAQLEADVAELKEKKGAASPGLDVAILGAVVAITAFWIRRRQ